jgi:hypothetical protein
MKQNYDVILALSNNKKKRTKERQRVQQLRFSMSWKTSAYKFLETNLTDVSLWNSQKCNLKGLLGEKRQEALLFHKIVTIHMSPFLTSFFADKSFLWTVSGKFPLLLRWKYGNPNL